MQTKASTPRPADGGHATDYKFWGLTECDGGATSGGKRAEGRGQRSGKARKREEGRCGGDGASVRHRRGGKGRGGAVGRSEFKHTGARPVDGVGRGGGDLLEQVGVCSGAFEDEVVAIYAVD